MRISFWRFVLIVATAVSLIGYPKPATATTFNVTVGPGGMLVFDPESVTINPGDQVKWTWDSGGHSTTSGSPGMPNGIWDSGIHNGGATFTRTFNSAGTFPYYCIPHGGCCGMVGTVTVVNASPTPNPTPTPTPSGTPPSSLANISTRSFVQTLDNVMIGGFIVHGSQPKRVIIRAIGPELIPFGVPDVLANPTLELHNGAGALIAFNDDWQTTVIGGVIIHDQVQDIINSGRAPTDMRESAIIADLPAGNYTAIVRGLNTTTGVALVEVYDLSPAADSILANISTRSFVQTMDNVMIGGFIVQGTQSKMVIIRAIGPELIPFGVPNALADPTLELHNGAGALIASNDNWQTTIIGGIIMHDQVQEIINSGHAPTDMRESAIIANLPAGNYTAIVRGVSNTTGVALVEVYDLQ
jgi:plastocyanin